MAQKLTIEFKQKYHKWLNEAIESLNKETLK